MDTKKICLFGGALMAAGIASNAEAGLFTFGGGPLVNGDNVGSLDAYAYDYNTEDSIEGDAILFLGDPLPVNLDLSDSGFSVSSSITQDGLNLSAAVSAFDGDASAYGNFFFTVDEQVDVLFEWDLDSNFEFFSSFAPVDNVGFVDEGAQFGNLSASGTTGSQTITLDPGFYQLRGTVLADTGGTGSGSLTATFVPAPGAAALLGLGGLAAMRRRR